MNNTQKQVFGFLLLFAFVAIIGIATLWDSTREQVLKSLFVGEIFAVIGIILLISSGKKLQNVL